MPVCQPQNGLRKDRQKGVGLTSGEPNNKEFEDTARGQGWGGRECADAQTEQDSPRGGELITQKAIAGCMEQGLQGCRWCGRR